MHTKLLYVSMIEYSGKVTVFDRLAVGFGIAVVTFITLLLAWLAMHWLFLRGGETEFLYLMKPIIVTSSVAGLFGILNKEKFIINLFAPIWKSIVNVFSAP